jgi:hypothetical protein
MLAVGRIDALRPEGRGLGIRVAETVGERPQRAEPRSILRPVLGDECASNPMPALAF